MSTNDRLSAILAGDAPLPPCQDVSMAGRARDEFAATYASPPMPPQFSRAKGRVKIEQPVATVENTSAAVMPQRAAEWERLRAEQAKDGYHFVCGYQGIVTFSAGREANRRPDRHFTSNLAHQLVPCDLWGYALPTP